MKHAKLNHNKQFMFGIMAMALVVIGVVILFWMWCFPQGIPDKPESKRYEVQLLGFRGDSLQVSLDDQILFDGTVDGDTCILGSDYPEKQAVLMVGSFRRDELVTFEVSDSDSPITVCRENDEIKMKKK